MKKIVYLAILFPLMLIAQTPTATQNYVWSKTYKVPTTTSISSPTPVQATQSVTYFDGLGRPIQQIAHKQAGNGKDMVTHIEYDAFGRQDKEYLPYVPTAAASLEYKTTALTDVGTYYNNSYYENTNNPFSQKLFEASPLNRVFQQAAPGDEWRLGSGHEVKFDYQTNQDDEVRLFKVSLQSNYTPSLINNNDSYLPNHLYKSITKDENWVGGSNNTTEEFKDKEGRVVLKRTYGESKVGNVLVFTNHDTYYVYDDYGNLTYVIPPLVDINQAIDTNVLDNLCYQYQYDYRNRLIEKKLPGKQREYIAYNSQDKPVATGPAFSPWGGNEVGWLITKYDVFGRVVYTGWRSSTVNSSSRLAFENQLNTSWAEYFNDRPTTIDGVETNYTNDTYPTDFKLLTINYYDGYTYIEAPTLPTTILGDNVLTNCKTLPTGSWVRVLNDPNNTNADISYTLYDTKARPIRTHQLNYLNGYTTVDSKLDFVGKTLLTNTYHKRNAESTEIIVKEVYEYTPQGRLLVHKHRVNDLPEELITKNDYDPLGQLITKQVGGQNITNFVGLQKVDYRYNIRGWLTNINNFENLQEDNAPIDFFAFKINYTDVENSVNGTVSPLYNGNISETFWRTSTDNVIRKYGYQYDNLNRLINSFYQKPALSNPITNMYNEQMDYDKNGNIQSLKRNGDFDSNIYGFMEIDDLVYGYDGNLKNQLVNVTDNTIDPKGFKDVNTGNADYEYDANGNMIKDENKYISSIFYNHLNLPTQINFATGDKIEYLYNATGQKKSKKVTQADTETVTDYLDGYQYTNEVLNFFPHAEGYVNMSYCRRCDEQGSKFEFNYVYNYTDHLGNIRVSYSLDKIDRVLKILEENHYYPFGLKHTNYNSGNKKYYEEDIVQTIGMEAAAPAVLEAFGKKIIQTLPSDGVMYKYKYNGFELQDELGLNWYDYKARNYDPALGRWMNIDPLAETSRRYSPYTYCLNNPIYYIDPDGMQADDWKDKNGKTLNQDQLNKVKVYIFYNPKESGEDGGFGEQTMKQYADYEKKYGKGSVAISDAMTEKDFAQDWGDISGTPNLIAMNHHGTNQALHLDVDPDGNPETKDGEYIVSTNDGKTNGSGTQGTKISDLPETKGDISNTVLKLNTCNSNNPSSSTMTPGTTLAKGFSRDTDVGVVRGTNKKVNFDSNGNPQPQWYYGGGWQFFKDGAQLSTSQVRDLKPN